MPHDSRLHRLLTHAVQQHPASGSQPSPHCTDIWETFCSPPPARAPMPSAALVCCAACQTQPDALPAPQVLIHAPLLRTFFLSGGHVPALCPTHRPAAPGSCLSCSLVSCFTSCCACTPSGSQSWTMCKRWLPCHRAVRQRLLPQLQSVELFQSQVCMRHICGGWLFMCEGMRPAAEPLVCVKGASAQLHVGCR